MARVGQWISLLQIFAVIPRLELLVLAGDREAVGLETNEARSLER